MRSGRSPSGSVANNSVRSDTQMLGAAVQSRSTGRSHSLSIIPEAISQPQRCTLPPRVESIAKRLPSGDQLGAQ